MEGTHDQPPPAHSEAQARLMAITTGPAATPKTAASIKPGLHNITASAYHADPCAKPSLSATIAKILCDESPAHAWQRHPRLNPDFERVESPAFDLGTAAHAMLLEGRDIIVPVDAPDWRTKDAREKRDAIRARGKIPLLTEQWERIGGLHDAIQTALAGLDMWPLPLRDGKPEQTIIWHEPGGVTCRGRIDWLRNDLVALDDLKTTSRGAHPLTWAERRMWDLGMDVQAAYYQRGLKAITGELVEPRFVIVESIPPFAVTVLGLAPSAMEQAHAKVQWAIDTWRHCIKTNRWPAYPTQVCYAELPSWQATKWAEQRFIETEGTPEPMPSRLGGRTLS